MTVLTPPYALGANVDPTPDYLRHSARMDRLSLGAMWLPSADALGAASGFLHGPAGSMGEMTLAANGSSLRINPFRAVVQGTQQAAQGQYLVPNDAFLDLPIPAQDATLARRARIVVGVNDSQAAAVESSEDTDQAYVAIFSSELDAAPTLPDLPANAFTAGELLIPRQGNGLPTLNHVLPRTGIRHGILPVTADNAVVPGHAGWPGAFEGQYRRHPDRGLEEWDGDSWEYAVGGLVRQLQLSANWAGNVVWARVGRLITAQVNLTWRGGLVNVGRWGAVVLGSGMPGVYGVQPQDSLSLAIPGTNNTEFGGWQLNVGGDGRLYLVARWSPRSFNKDTWVTGSFSYVAQS